MWKNPNSRKKPKNSAKRNMRAISHNTRTIVRAIKNALPELQLREGAQNTTLTHYRGILRFYDTRFAPERQGKYAKLQKMSGTASRQCEVLPSLRGQAGIDAEIKKPR